MACFGLAPGAAAAAGKAVLVSESEFFADIPSVDTVTRLPQPRSETPAAVTIIDGEMIRASGARDLADLFRLVPGFQVAYPRGHRPAVTYHGLGEEYTRRMQILIDGRSVFGALVGHVSWSTQAVAIEDIERIEVIRGPNTAAYGANAFLGTINIITRHAVQDRGTSLKLTGGNHDIRDAVVRHGTALSAGDLRVTAGTQGDDGLEGLPDDNRTRFVNLRADLQPGLHDSLLFQAGVARAKLQEGFFGNAQTPPTPTTVEARFEQIRWQRGLGGGDAIALQLYHNRRATRFDYLTDPIDLGPPLGPVQVPVNLDFYENRYDLELQHTLNPWAGWRFVWGAGARRDGAETMAYFATSEMIKSRSSRLFGNGEWRATRDLIVNAGAMWEHVDLTGSDLSPRLALNYHLDADHTVRMAWSKAHRVPVLFEERADQRHFYQGTLLEHQFNAVGGLRPEIMTSYELGYLGRVPKWNATLDARVYRDRISDFITMFSVPAADLDGRALSFRNEGEVTVDGVDMELSYRPGRDSRIVLTYARMHASGTQVGADATLNEKSRLDSVPQYSGSLLALHRFPGDWHGSVAYYRVGRMLWNDSIGAFGRLDLRLARRMRLSDTQGELALVVQNAGHRYEEFSNDQFFERRVFLSFRLDW
ncbi:MAG: TonB-dependent receptor [Burkholderiales bacterium]